MQVQADSGSLYINPDQIVRIYREGERTVVTFSDGSSIRTPEYDTALVARIRDRPQP
jgi:hypothetical protein